VGGKRKKKEKKEEEREGGREGGRGAHLESGEVEGLCVGEVGFLARVVLDRGLAHFP